MGGEALRLNEHAGHFQVSRLDLAFKFTDQKPLAFAGEEIGDDDVFRSGGGHGYLPSRCQAAIRPPNTKTITNQPGSNGTWARPETTNERLATSPIQP